MISKEESQPNLRVNKEVIEDQNVDHLKMSMKSLNSPDKEEKIPKSRENYLIAGNKIIAQGRDAPSPYISLECLSNLGINCSGKIRGYCGRRNVLDTRSLRKMRNIRVKCLKILSFNYGADSLEGTRTGLSTDYSSAAKFLKNTRGSMRTVLKWLLKANMHYMQLLDLKRFLMSTRLLRSIITHSIENVPYALYSGLGKDSTYNTKRYSNFIRLFIPKTLKSFTVTTFVHLRSSNLFRAFATKNIKKLSLSLLQKQTDFFSPKAHPYPISRFRNLESIQTDFLEPKTVIKILKSSQNLRSISLPVSSHQVFQYILSSKLKVQHLTLHQFDILTTSMQKCPGTLEELSQQFFASFPYLNSLQILMYHRAKPGIFEAIRYLNLANFDMECTDDQFDLACLKNIIAGLSTSKDRLTRFQLKLEGMPGKSLPLEVFDELKALFNILRNLQVLNFWCDYKITGDLVHMFDILRCQTNLEILKIGFRSEITSTEMLGGLSKVIRQNQELKELLLANNFAGVQELSFTAIIQEIQSLPRLKSFEFSTLDKCQNWIVNIIEEILINSKVLERFTLHTGEGLLNHDSDLMKLFSAIERSKTLREFSLDTYFDKVSDDGFLWLAENMNKLRRLSLIRIYIRMHQLKNRNTEVESFQIFKNIKKYKDRVL